MSEKKTYFHIGKIVATHGLKGELLLKHALGKKSTLKNVKALFIKDKANNHLPWFLESSSNKNESETYIKLEGIGTVEAAKPLLQKDVWLTESDFNKHASKTAAISLLGNTIFDGDHELGIIEEVIEQPHQILCRLHVQNKEVFIPLHEKTLKMVDAKNKIVYVELPEGLLDIYLS